MNDAGAGGKEPIVSVPEDLAPGHVARLAEDETRHVLPLEVEDAAAPDESGAVPEVVQTPKGGTSRPSVSLGARLKAARLAQNLLAEDVAGQLKIGARKIDAIEAERWDQLPSGPYLRGLLRNYAKILKADSAAVVEDIERLAGAPAVAHDISLLPSLRTPFPQRRRSHDSAMARLMRVGTLVFAVLAGLIAWSGTQSFRESEEIMTSWLAARAKPEAAALNPGQESIAPVQEPVTPARTGAPVSRVSTELGQSPSAAASSSKPAASPQVAPALTLAAIATGTTGVDGSQPQALSGDIVMRFNDDSWVEVRQADGKILMSQLNHAGAGKALDGSPPLELVIGNAPGVALQYRGSAVDLAPYTRDRVAHITLK
jgi:cytoskeleton protein RodZ